MNVLVALPGIVAHSQPKKSESEFDSDFLIFSEILFSYNFAILGESTFRHFAILRNYDAFKAFAKMERRFADIIYPVRNLDLRKRFATVERMTVYLHDVIGDFNAL